MSNNTGADWKSKKAIADEKFHQLVQAIRSKNKITARSLILHHPEIDYNLQAGGRSLLHWAVIYFEDTEIIELLLDKNIDVDALNNRDKTAIFLAVELQKVEIVKLLLNKGTHSINDLKILLHHASQKKNYRLVEPLFEYIFYLKRRINSEFYYFAYVAAKIGNARMIENFIQLGIDVNMINEDSGFSLLHIACWQNYVDVVQILIKYQADVNLKVFFDELSNAAQSFFKRNHIPNGVTPLWIATVKSSQPFIANLLVDRGAMIEYDPNCDLIINTVVKKKWITVLETMVDHGLKIHATTVGQTTILNFFTNFQESPTSTADTQNKIPKLLLTKGININFPDDNQETLLFHAIHNGNIKMTELLLSNNANVQHKNINGDTPLHLATRYFIDTKFVEILLRYNAKVNEINKDSLVPLHFACDEGNIKKIQILLDYNAGVNVADKFGKTPLHFVCTRGEIWVPEVLKLLLQYTGDINVRDLKGKSPLFEACEVGNVSVINILLENGADMECKDNRGDTPLHIALKRFSRNWECVKSLLDAKKSSFVSYEERKPLYHFFAEYNFSILELLIQKDLDINTVDGSGQTALHIAADRGHIDMVRDLIINGADVNAVNNYKLTALHYVLRRISYFREELYDHRLVIEFRRSYNMKNTEYGHYYHGREKVFFYKREINSYKKIRNILQEQIIKLKCANFSINEYNYDLVYFNNCQNDQECDNFSDDEDENVYSINVRNYENQCYREIQELKQESISNTDITLYDVLTQSLETIAPYTKDVNVMNILRLNKYNKFKCYIDIIKYRIKEAEKIMLNTVPSRPHDFSTDGRISDFIADNKSVYINREQDSLKIPYGKRLLVEYQPLFYDGQSFSKKKRS
ncbi:putative ankyrin repeat protein RF_0381 [Chelonus insularis]|uniref:putative ankyrin repeat protein RF_0381 n=1 Tax=Chelonus insularis TaxID=460826 RepID=UPI00158E6DC7|nr:putative ankyrin repeat protein RF_0381 [Chelonus insularis]